MAMRMTGIEVIGGDPVQLRAEILFHAAHQAADERLQVFVARAIVRRHHEPELVAILAATLQESITIGMIMPLVIKFAGQALTRHAVALDIAQVKLRRLQPPTLDPHYPRLDNDTALAKGRVCSAFT